MTLYPKLIIDALATVMYAGTKKNLVESQMVADQPAINGNKVTVVLEFPRDTDPFLKSTVKAAEAAIKYQCGQDVEVTVVTEFKSKPRPAVEQLLPGVKNIGGGAFAKCVSLREVIVNAPLPPKIAKSSFKDIVLGACQFYIPRGTKNNYLQDKQWQKIPKLNER